jgi:hypothetical protein
VRNPLSSEEAAFGLLVRVVVAVAVLVLLVLLLRAVF